jgi:hypothetical protein
VDDKRREVARIILNILRPLADEIAQLLIEEKDAKTNRPSDLQGSAIGDQPETRFGIWKMRRTVCRRRSKGSRMRSTSDCGEKPAPRSCDRGAGSTVEGSCRPGACSRIAIEARSQGLI